MKRSFRLSRLFYVCAGGSFIFSLLTALVSVVNGMTNLSVEGRVLSLTTTLQSVGFMITAGLLLVAGTILTASEQSCQDRAEPTAPPDRKSTQS
jgi:hypothetical protein